MCILKVLSLNRSHSLRGILYIILLQRKTYLRIVLNIFHLQNSYFHNISRTNFRLVRNTRCNPYYTFNISNYQIQHKCHPCMCQNIHSDVSGNFPRGMWCINWPFYRNIRRNQYGRQYKTPHHKIYRHYIDQNKLHFLIFFLENIQCSHLPNPQYNFYNQDDIIDSVR